MSVARVRFDEVEQYFGHLDLAARPNNQFHSLRNRLGAVTSLKVLKDCQPLTPPLFLCFRDAISFSLTVGAMRVEPAPSACPEMQIADRG